MRRCGITGGKGRKKEQDGKPGSREPLTDRDDKVSEKHKTLNYQLYQAALYGITDEVKRLLDKGADVNYTDPDAFEATPLMQAAHHGHNDVVELLLENGADSYAKSDTGSTALRWAYLGRHCEAAEIIKKHRIEQFFDAVESGELAKVVSILYEAKTAAKKHNEGSLDIDSKNKYGYTALMLASEQGNTEIVKVLLQNGADFTLTNKEGKNALNMAEENGRTETVKVLESI